MINAAINCFCSEKVEEDVFSSKDVEERLLDLYVELLKSGPGSSHCELLQLIPKQVEIQVLLNTLLFYKRC